MRGAERHAITVVGVVVVAVAVVVDITEVRAVAGVRRTQPPVVSLKYNKNINKYRA